MKILLIFTLCLISGALGLREVIAYAGGGVNIKCKYKEEYKDKPKAFCKNGTNQWCFNQTQSHPISEWSHDGRFSVHYNKSAGLLRVFIRKLVTEDTGTYMCAVAVSDKIQNYSVVKLEVRKDPSYEESISKTVHVGGDLNISFKYPESLANWPKYLCKKLQTATCSHKVSVNAGNKLKETTKGKFSLYDDRQRQSLSVSLRNVTEGDSGEYWCGAEAAWKTDDGYKVHFTQINLTVIGSTLKPATASSSPSTSSTSSLSLSSSQAIPASPPTGFPAFIVITVSVILLLLLIGITFFTLTVQKRRKIEAGRAFTDQCSVLNSGNNQEVPLAVCEYEEIKDIRRLYASEHETSAVYSSVQLPTMPSDPSLTVCTYTELPTSPCDSDVYSTAQLPTIPSDQGVYSTAQLPTIPSDQNIYSTAQLPTGHSAEKSAEVCLAQQ